MATADEVVTAMKPEMDAFLRGQGDALAATWTAAANEAGPAQVMSTVFLRFADATLSSWLLGTAFIWKEFSFAEWKEVLACIAHDAPALYQFIPFATRYLAIDIVRVIREEPDLDPMAQTFAAERFSKGGPAPGDEWIREMLEDNGIDQYELWRRLASEGAPMRAEALSLLQ